MQFIIKKKNEFFFIRVQNSRKCSIQSLQNGPTCFVMCHTFVLLAQMYLIFIFMLSLKFISGTDCSNPKCYRNSKNMKGTLLY